MATRASTPSRLWLGTHHTAVARLLLVVITLVNLRGVQEAGTVMIVLISLFYFPTRT
ncbi:MAG: hypothetical protein IPG51_13040 [Chloroflexi bacterium]|nr:hypothetical protein [Chloroflexota bacterium]